MPPSTPVGPGRATGRSRLASGTSPAWLACLSWADFGILLPDTRAGFGQRRGSPEGKQPSRIFLSNHDQRNHDFILPQSVIPYFFIFFCTKCTVKRETQNHLVNIHPMTKKYPNGKRRSLGPSFFLLFFSSWPQTGNNQSIN